MSRNLKVVNTEDEVQSAIKKLSSPYVIYIKDIEKVIYRRPSSDVIILIDDWNNFRDLLPTIQRDITWITPKRCLVKKTDDGVAICYLDENNSELFHDGVTEAKLDGSMGQWMVDLPEFYIECYEGESDWVKLYIDRNPGFGVLSERVLLGATKTTISDGKMWSRKYNLGQSDNIHYDTIPLNEITTYTQNLEEGFSIMDYNSYCKIAYLFMSKYKSRDPQKMKMYGYKEIENWMGINDIAGQTSHFGNNPGMTDDLENLHFSLLGLEDYAGRYPELLSGIQGYRELDENELTVYIYDGVEYGQTPSTDYRTLNLTHNLGMSGAYGYVDRLEWGEYSDLLPIGLNGSYSLHYNTNTCIGRKGWSVFTNGSSNTWQPSLFALYNDFNESNEPIRYYTRLQYRGKIEVIEDPQEFIELPTGF